MSLVLSLALSGFIIATWMSGFYLGISRQKRNNKVTVLELKNQLLEAKNKILELEKKP